MDEEGIKWFAIAIIAFALLFGGTAKLFIESRCPKCGGFFTRKKISSKSTKNDPSWQKSYDEVITQFKCNRCGHTWKTWEREEEDYDY